MVSMDRLRWARPNVLERVLRANLLAMIGRLRGLPDTFVRFADMTSPRMCAQTSLAVARVRKPARSNPQSHRASPGNEIAKVTQVMAIGIPDRYLCMERPRARALPALVPTAWQQAMLLRIRSSI